MLIVPWKEIHMVETTRLRYLALAAPLTLVLSLGSFAAVQPALADDGSNLAAAGIAQNDAQLNAQAVAGANLKAAMKKYGISDENVTTVKKTGEIQSTLYSASSEATAKKRQIVYVPSGTHKLGSLSIPENVLLVSESKTKFVCSSKTDRWIQIYGSIYGGNFDAAKKVDTGISLAESSYKNNNGMIEKATISNTYGYGICAKDGSQGSKIINTTVSKCGKNGSESRSGICSLDGAKISLISGCKILNSGTAGINLSCANVGIIENCMVNGGSDKGVSTNSKLDGKKLVGCTIDAIRNCTFKNFTTHGVHMKPACTLKEFSGNKVINCGSGLTATMENHELNTAGSKVVIKKVNNNTFQGSKLSTQVRAIGKGASISMGSGNKVLNGKVGGIEAQDGATLTVKGDNNLVQGQKEGAGLKASNSGKLTMSGKNNVVKGNKLAVYCVDKGKMVLKGVKLSGTITKKDGGVVTQS